MASADPSAKALTVRCQCGNVSFPTPSAPRIALFHCHCTECQKQSGSAFGTSAIYPAAGLFPLSPALESKLGCYVRSTDKKDGTLMRCWFCRACGSRLFHRLVEPDGSPHGTVSIKGGCIKGLDWAGGKHIYMRSAVVNVPEGTEHYDTLPPGEEMQREEPCK
ncbi:Mss4-like protein [Apiospora phragmitis]|uniref:Mss4-like protein n=1 Tax=Apiospora phragmitis TaxID=2905665 RepID=A0ABR1VXK3_9PEZI